MDQDVITTIMELGLIVKGEFSKLMESMEQGAQGLKGNLFGTDQGQCVESPSLVKSVELMKTVAKGSATGLFVE